MVALLTEGVSSPAEGELAIDETASTVNLVSNLCVVPETSVAVREGEQCLQEFWDHLSRSVLEGEADDNDSFVDIMSGITAVGNAESECWTFADALARANFLVETLAEGVVDACLLPTR